MAIVIKTLGIPALILLSILGLGAAFIALWLLLPELRPTLRSVARGVISPLRRSPLISGQKA